MDKLYTVVGYYSDTLETFVDVVEASTPFYAAQAAVINCDTDTRFVIEVFEGELECKLCPTYALSKKELLDGEAACGYQ